MSMPVPPHASTTPFVPVVLGGDLPTYTLARAFHEELGARTTVLSRGIPAAVRGSSIVDNLVVPGLDDPDEVVRAVHGVADANPGATVLLLGTMDWWIERIGSLRHRLDERVAVPYPELGLIERMSDKEQFAALCAELRVAHPRTVVLGPDVAEPEVGGLLTDLRPPYVVKAADPPAFHNLIYPGKQKVGFAADLPELLRLRRTMSGAGYAGALVVQERIPGGDEQMRLLTTYSDRTGKVRWGRVGHVLLEDHDPAWIGNPLAVMHGTSATALAEATRLLEHVGWTGYANFDLKVDPRDGREHFFELNPRLGRSHGYLTAAGHPVVTPYVREHVEGRDPYDDVTTGAETDDWLYAIVPVPLLRRYVTDPATRERLSRVRREGRVMRPFVYPPDRGRHRRLAQLKNDVLFVKDFATHYRRPATS
ncbi:carboxylate--amine ligase [Ornithinimicrobium cerasi]|uniref:carboxylate--amine ligase n=1 Tax=Ornithinimicrobium cerasi TaxID=2248773 RepID=UPI00137A669E|nr:carboxylate--amine ligase [Ornithinimicrobium cerasi]